MKTHRDTGFDDTKRDANELAKTLEVEPVFQGQRTRTKTRLFGYESAHEPISDPKTEFRVDFFNQVVDRALQSPQPRYSAFPNLCIAPAYC